ncbi:MAG: GyrI-like domain-containing protein [Propionibacteriaceae bacterium]|jgi:hypothetical protein|nr:GyrI-like domain-containing protein [Propionibacteriaceae bacterium]
MAMDVKKTQKAFYNSATTPTLVDLPELTFLMVDGRGDPNTAASYFAAIESLYTVAYAIKMSKMSSWRIDGYEDFVVPPLEGLWSTVDDKPFQTGVTNKDDLTWTSMVQMPSFVTQPVFDQTVEVVAAKKPEVDVTRIRLDQLTEGSCAQILHIGPYDSEPATIAVLEQFIEAQGRTIDLGHGRRHHEIYLSDPRRVAQDKLKTIIRLPVAPR